MKRFHVNLSVADLSRSVSFYNHLFGQEPNVLKTDYAKWMLDDPRINFSLTTHGAEKGIDHLGIQSDDEQEFNALRDQLHAADMTTFDQPDVVCCYARSSKAWVRDPDNVAWETFVSLGTSARYDDGTERESPRNAKSMTQAAKAADGVENSTRCCA